MTTIYSIYDQLAEIIARAEPEKVLEMRASEGMQKRFYELAEKSKNEEISREERNELNHFVVIERLLRLAKVRAEYNLAA